MKQLQLTKMYWPVVLALTLFFSGLHAQDQDRIAYYDAIALSKLYESNKPDGIPVLNAETWEVLKYYYPDRLDLPKVFTNPFLKNYFAQGTSASLLGTAEFSKNLEQGFGGLGGLNVTTIADGLAKFLVKRTKQELNINFFQRFIDVLEDDKTKDLQLLFPDTYGVLKIVDQEVYQFANYINTLRETFEKDLQNILTNLEAYLDTNRKNRYATDGNDEIAQKIEYFQAALLLVNNIRQGSHPAEAIGRLKDVSFNPNNKILIDVKEAAKVFTIFSNSLRSTNTNRYWINTEESRVLTNPVTFNIYLGLLYQQYGAVPIFQQSFGEYLKRVAEDDAFIENYKNYIKKFIEQSEKVALAITDIKQKKNAGEKLDSYKELFQSSVGLLKNLEEVSKLNFGIELIEKNGVIHIFDLVNSIYLDINEGKYNALIVDLSNLLTKIFGERNFAWKNELVRYGTFVANVAKAEDSDEVQAAIEAIALPVGSASIKKGSKFNVALNSYVGLSGGYERNGQTGDFDFSLGVNAPVGVALSWGHNTTKRSGSSSLYFPLIDIGAVTSFRFGDDQTEELPEIKLENIFAPGVYYVYGFPKAPVSLGLGGQFGPQLREITLTDNSNLDNGISFTLQFFIAVDIPLLNFYTKSR